jgi:hypothetical protein
VLLDLAAVDKLKVVLKVALLGCVQPVVQHGCSALQAAILQQGLQHATSLAVVILVAQCAIAAAAEVTMQTFLLPAL